MCLLAAVAPSILDASSIEEEPQRNDRGELLETDSNRGPDRECLFDTELLKCAPDEGEDCPDGFRMNEDGNCFPEHDQCPRGHHSHEDDESGECIPDSVECDEGYIRDPDFPQCAQKESVCEKHPEIKECQ